MKLTLLAAVAALAVSATPAFAGYTANDSGGDCLADGSACNVYCNDNNRASIMYWNGSVWTDGVKSDPDFATEAGIILAANGTSCQ